MARNKLLVEGKNDQIVISTLCQHHDIWVENKGHSILPPEGKSYDFECRNQKNIQQLLDQDLLRTELKESGVESMGIVADVDANLSHRWQAICDRLRAFGYVSLPDVPDPLGTIISDVDLPTVGVWLMPDNRLEGQVGTFH